MATRANIVIKSKSAKAKVIIYHHYDGDIIGEDIKAYLKTNHDYQIEDIVNAMIKGQIAEDDGYEFDVCIGSDIEYLYEIDCDNRRLKKYHIDYSTKKKREESI